MSNKWKKKIIFVSQNTLLCKPGVLKFSEVKQIFCHFFGKIHAVT